MAKNFWMVVQTPENFKITKDMGFTLHGVGGRYKRRAERMQPDDRVLFYVEKMRVWTAAATISSRYFEDQTPIWKSTARGDQFPYRVNMAPDIALDEEDYIDALILAPRLEYVKRWAPEDWPLAFHDRLHLLPQRDFRLIEGEMKRIVSRRRRERRAAGSAAGAGQGAEPVDGSAPQAEGQAPEAQVGSDTSDGPVSHAEEQTARVDSAPSVGAITPVQELGTHEAEVGSNESGGPAGPAAAEPVTEVEAQVSSAESGGPTDPFASEAGPPEVQVSSDESGQPVTEVEAQVSSDESREPVVEVEAQVSSDESREPVTEVEAQVSSDESREPVTEVEAQVSSDESRESVTEVEAQVSSDESRELVTEVEEQRDREGQATSEGS